MKDLETECARLKKMYAELELGHRSTLVSDTSYFLAKVLLRRRFQELTNQPFDFCLCHTQRFTCYMNHWQANLRKSMSLRKALQRLRREALDMFKSRCQGLPRVSLKLLVLDQTCRLPSQPVIKKLHLPHRLGKLAQHQK